MPRLLDILSGVGNVLDLPGSSIRDALALQNPLDQWASPFSQQNRTSGRQLLRRYGLAGEEDTGLNAAGGMAAEMALDPLSWLGVGLAAKGAGTLGTALRGAGAAQVASRGAPGALMNALKSAARPAVAYSIGAPVAGAYLMGDNEENAGWKNVLGTALMASPLVIGMAKGAKGVKKQFAKWSAAEEAKAASAKLIHPDEVLTQNLDLIQQHARRFNRGSELDIDELVGDATLRFMNRLRSDFPEGVPSSLVGPIANVRAESSVIDSYRKLRSSKQNVAKGIGGSEELDLAAGPVEYPEQAVSDDMSVAQILSSITDNPKKNMPLRKVAETIMDTIQEQDAKRATLNPNEAAEFRSNVNLSEVARKLGMDADRVKYLRNIIAKQLTERGIHPSILATLGLVGASGGGALLRILQGEPRQNQGA